MTTKWERRFLRLAQHVASWSKDPSTQVGAVIVDSDRRVLGLGYNGFPRGVYDDRERYVDRKLKYPRIVHAEANAVLNCRSLDDVVGSRLFVTLPPCCECAKLIIQAGILEVYVPADLPVAAMERWEASMEVTDSMFMEAGVRLHWI